MILCVLVNHVAGWACMAALFVYVAVMTARSFLAVEIHGPEDSAKILYNYNHGKTEGLPAKLQGVFWMSTNAAPELLASIDGSYWDPKRRMVNFHAGATYNWTYSSNLIGWIYWFGLRVSYMFCSEMHLNFNEDITYASMPLYVCGCCPDSCCCCDGCWLPTGMIWTMKQVETDENAWDRDISLYCNPKKRWGLGSYKLVRIIDENGQKLPGYAAMVEQMQKTSADGTTLKTKAIYAKPARQLMNGHDCIGNVFFGSAGNPEDYMHSPRVVGSV
jgi:hypothetical protein